MTCKKSFYTEKVSYWYLLAIPIGLLSPSLTTVIIPVAMVPIIAIISLIFNFFWEEKGVFFCLIILVPATIAMMIMSFIDGFSAGILQAL